MIARIDGSQGATLGNKQCQFSYCFAVPEESLMRQTPNPISLTPDRKKTDAQLQVLRTKLAQQPCSQGPPFPVRGKKRYPGDEVVVRVACVIGLVNT